MKINENIRIKYIIIIALIIGFSIASGVGCYYIYNFVQTKKQNNNRNIRDNLIKDIDTIPVSSFIPILEDRYFQKFVNKDRFNNKYIDQNLINEIVKDLVRRLKSSNGKFYFDYDILSQQHATLRVMYISDDYSQKDEKIFEILLD
ncbi:MHO_1590 family protein [Mycoplasmopsis verecunda]|uniref:Lipoprotein n=1 Tax=Mycoplasmopsis verecunda TaxID=171291 RepID=A0A1T4KTJ4_9BACT|nr:hypothetical protein [Mycoplasmopsis verecunda]WPB54655.1 hypothetical protein SAM46_00630 [Mycoplasmopsis verecunda]SJZ45774.1 hypothetical protein SAMN02745154_00178 [Mycoplasmopsis verecunda]